MYRVFVTSFDDFEQTIEKRFKSKDSAITYADEVTCYGQAIAAIWLGKKLIQLLGA